MFILFDHCTNYTTHAVKPLNIEFGVSNTDILAEIWDFSHFGPKFSQKCHCDVMLRWPILFILLDHCTDYTTHAVKPSNIEFGVSYTDILAKIWDFSHFRVKFAQISHCDVTVRCQILIILLDHCTINMIWSIKPLNIVFGVSNTTLDYLINGHARLFFLRKKSTLDALIWSWTLINFWRKIHPGRLIHRGRLFHFNDILQTIQWLPRNLDLFSF